MVLLKKSRLQLCVQVVHAAEEVQVTAVRAGGAAEEVQVTAVHAGAAADEVQVTAVHAGAAAEEVQVTAVHAGGAAEEVQVTAVHAGAAAADEVQVTAVRAGGAAEEVQVTAVLAGASNCTEGDGKCFKRKPIHSARRENSHTSVLDKPLSNYSECLPWHHQSASGNDTVCVCSHSHRDLVQYDDPHNELRLHVCYCMYFNEQDDSTIVGHCFYTCFYHHVYFPLPLNGSQLNEAQCDSLGREGVMCGRCKEGYSLPVYSHQFLSCVKCHDYNYKNWMKYIAIAFGPLTVFYIIVIVCRISATSAKLNAFILTNQIVTMPAHVRVLLAIMAKNHVPPLERVILHTVFSVYGIWNLDFFRTFYEPFCLHPDMSPLQVLALDYIVAAYPLILIVITYTLVELHDRNIRIVVLLWKPFHRCFSRFRRQWNIRTSLIDAFVTFILLSCVKFLSVTFDLLAPTRIFNSHGDTLGQYRLYYDSTVVLFDNQHRPYALVAVGILSLLVSLFLLLCLYPCTCFQRCLNCCRIRFQALHTFMDSFQGCYRSSPRDCRYFAVVYFILRIAMLIAYVAIVSPFAYLIAVALTILTAIVVVVVKPYKSPVQNTVDVALLLLLALGLLSVGANINANKVDFECLTLSRLMVYAVAPFPLVYLFALLLNSLFCQRPAIKILFRRVFACGRSRSDSMESLPHRIGHAEEYTRLGSRSEATYGSTDSPPSG